MDQLSSPSLPSDRDDLIDPVADFSNPLAHPFSNTLYPFHPQSPFPHDNNVGGIPNGNEHHHGGNGWQGTTGGKMGESSGTGFMGAGMDMTSGTTTGEILQPYAQMFTHNPHQHPQSTQPSHLNSSANNIRLSHTHHAQPHHPHLPSNYPLNQTHTHQSLTHTPNNVDLDEDDILATSIGSGQGVDEDLEAILPPAAMAHFRTSFDSGSGSGTVNTAELTGRGTPGMYGSMAGFGNQQDQHMNPNMSHHHPHASHSNYAQQQHQQQQQQQQQLPSLPATQPPSALSEEKARALESLLVKFWTRQMELAERGTASSSTPGNGAQSAVKDQEFKNFALPLARIKKVMKSDPDVKMISAEVPVLLGKCCEIFIAELTSRAWLVAQSNKRRTLQKTDVAAAIGYSDMFDFLIDIVPREEKGTDGPAAKKKAPTGRKDSELSSSGVPGDEAGKKRKREDGDDEENEEE